MKFLKWNTIAFFITITSLSSFAQHNNTGGDKTGEIVHLCRMIYSNNYAGNYDKVIEAIDKILTIDSSHIDKYNYVKGTFYHKKKDYENAAKIFKAGIQKHPTFPFNYSGMGFMLLDQKDKSCLSYFLKAKEKISSYQEPIQSEQQKQNYCFFDPDSINIYNGLASAYFFIEKYDSAYFYFNKSFQMDQRRIATMAKMAECKFMLYDFDKADKLALQALQLDRYNRLALFIRSEILWYNGKKDKCIKLLDETILYAEAFIKPYQSIMPDKSDTIYDRYNSQNARYKSSLYSSRAYYKSHRKDFSKAKADIEKAFAHDSTYLGVYNSKAIYHMMRNDTIEMFKAINKAIALDSAKNKSVESIYFNRAYFSYLVGNFQNALNDCNKALEIDSSGIYNYKRFTLLASIYHGLKENTLAISNANKGVDRGAIFAWPYVVRASIRLDNGERESAIKDLILAEKYDYSEEFTEEIRVLKTKHNILLPQK